MEGSRDNRGRIVPRPYTYVGKNPAKVQHSNIYGVFEGKEHVNDIWPTCKFKVQGYYVDTVGKNTKKIAEYIRNQLRQDAEYEQMSIKEYIDPFTGEGKNK